MYERFYGLRERPFDLTPNPKYLFLTPVHREALSNLQYGVAARKGITLLVGEAGTGKTTIIRTALGALLSTDVRAVYLSNPVLSRAEFYELLAAGFGLGPQAAQSKARFLLELEELIARTHEERRVTTLVIDEAQSLPHELMEEVRLLANLETPGEKLLPVVLAGQPELAARLNRPELRQLKQRVALRCELRPLTLEETAAYVSGRIRIAGGDGRQIFTREAVALVYERSGGIPRTISVICDNALVSGFAGDERPIRAETIREVCRDFDLDLDPVSARNGPRRRVNGSGAGAEVAPRVAAAGHTLFSHFTTRRRFSFF